jgi:hypothetical protein
MVKKRICIKCGAEFPNHIYINGKRIVLNRRKYCFQCSPFKAHNTLQLESINKMRYCIICERQLSGNQEKYCSSKCKYRKFIPKTYQRKEKNRIMAIEYLGGKCSKCGLIGYLDIYSFHHNNPDNKDFQLSHMFTYSWERIKKELDKCELVCGNCHMEIHHDSYQDNWQNRQRHKQKKKAIKYLGGKCIHCGYEKNFHALAFHHRDENEKSFTIADYLHRKWEILKNELDKCILLCINCHRILHYIQKNN